MKKSKFFGYFSKIALSLGLCCFLGLGSAHAQFFRNLMKKYSHDIPSPNKNGLSNLSNSEIASGLKEALEIGAKNASKQLSQKDGFLGNAAVKILLPPEVREVASTLRSMGMGNIVDDAILKMNRAAEDAAIKAAPIFVGAIKGITIQDGIQILKGGDDAATRYLEGRTSQQLTDAFSPVIKTSLDKVNAPEIWNKLFTTYNQIPFVKKVNPNLVSYVTQQALKGVFTEIAVEELKIRKDPAARVTGLLRKVFGNQ